MRRCFLPVLLVLAALLAGRPACAQDWKEYAYPDYAFAVSFPVEPTVEATTYQTAEGRLAPARTYAASAAGSIFKMTVVDLAGTSLAEAAILDHAVEILAQGREIKLDIPHRISRVFGRQLSLQAPDGSRSSVAVFFHDGRLYQIEGKSLAGGSGTSEAIRFQQSLVFTDSN
ncbi:MAG TPA: hypothetical protein VKW08_15260 [Xanthobacteraceae bacterium]|nr:hypothetical protein [Xanthobacteraceae bacterium]